MSKRFQGGILGVGFNPLQAPNAPTIGAATVASGTSASVAFTAPANVGGSAITSYAVQSTPGGIGASGASSPITVSGLTTGTAYTFRVTALNSYGPSPASAASNSVTPVIQGQQAYTSAGSYSFVVPACVTSVSVVTVGAGSSGGNLVSGAVGGVGAALRYVNNLVVTPGETLSVLVGAAPGAGGRSAGGNSSLSRGATVLARANGGLAGASGQVGTGGDGGSGGTFSFSGGGGGGAGGYSGNGGTGGSSGAGSSGAGGGGGGGGGSQSTSCGCTATHNGGGAGGGVGILGQGSNGSGGASIGLGGVGGSGGATGGNVIGTYSGGSGGLYGGSGGAAGVLYNTATCTILFAGNGGAGGGGAVRIIWPGTSRSFPSTNTGNL